MTPKIRDKEFLGVVVYLYRTSDMFICLPNMHKDTLTAHIAVDLFIACLIAILLKISSEL